MPEQLDLFAKVSAPKVTPEQVEQLCAWLQGKGWVHAADIEQTLGLKDRQVRAIAEHSEGRILSGPGCPGYKLFDGHAEIGEAERAAQRLESQARHMIDRAKAYRRRIHRYAH